MSWKPISTTSSVVAAVLLVGVPATAAVASLAGVSPAAVARIHFVEIAGRNAGNGKPPERGSSASIYGGSSADRYGGSSADHRGVGGQRDERVYRKPAKHADDNVVAKPKKDEEDDQDKEEEEEK